MSDNQTPDYYRIPTNGEDWIEPWHISHFLRHGYPIGAALKYLMRAGRKPGEPEEKDLIKAKRSIEQRLREIEAERREKLQTALKPKVVRRKRDGPECQH